MDNPFLFLYSIQLLDKNENPGRLESGYIKISNYEER